VAETRVPQGGRITDCEGGGTGKAASVEVSSSFPAGEKKAGADLGSWVEVKGIFRGTKKMRNCQRRRKGESSDRKG